MYTDWQIRFWIISHTTGIFFLYLLYVYICDFLLFFCLPFGRHIRRVFTYPFPCMRCAQPIVCNHEWMAISQSPWCKFYAMLCVRSSLVARHTYIQYWSIRVYPSHESHKYENLISMNFSLNFKVSRSHSTNINLPLTIVCSFDMSSVQCCLSSQLDRAREEIRKNVMLMNWPLYS